MAGRWVAAQDLFDAWSEAEDQLAFDRAGGHAYEFEMTTPVPRVSAAGDEEDEATEVDEFALEEALLDDQTTATLRIMAAEMTDTMALLDDETTGTLPAMA